MVARTLFAVLDDTAQLYGEAAALHQPTSTKGSAKYRSYSWHQYRDMAREVACGLRHLGIGRGDIVALHSETRAEFYIADLGVLGNGSIAAALYTSLSPFDHSKTVAATNPKAIFIEDAKAAKALADAGVGAGNPNLIRVLLTGSADGLLNFDELRQRGRDAMAADNTLWERIQAEVTPDDYAVLYMTSGATGEPKMGLVTHRAITSNLEMGERVRLTPADSTLAFLPSAHIAQRVGIEFLPIRFGVPVYFSEGLAKMSNEIKSIRPTFLLAPPRVWERIYASVQTEIRKRPALARRLFYTGLGLGLKASRLRQEGEPVPAWITRSLAVADKLIFSKVRQRLGGRLRLPVSGAAPLGRELAQFYEAIGMPLIEGYGLTEGGIVVLNPLDAPRPGSIGKVLPGVEVKVADDGELLFSSPTLFSGYYNDPDATASVLKQGWLHTGDVGELDKDGYVYITGRKKELIVSSNGKKIYPTRIENLFKLEPLINQVLLVGDRQPYVTALITINPATAEALPGMEPYKGRTMEDISSAPAVSAEVDRAIRRVNKQLAPFEHIKRFRILQREFSIDRGELTPTMKVRRKQVLDNYKAIISELYLGKEELA